MTHISKLKQIEKVLGWIIDTPYIYMMIYIDQYISKSEKL